MTGDFADTASRTAPYKKQIKLQQINKQTKIRTLNKFPVFFHLKLFFSCLLRLKLSSIFLSQTRFLVLFHFFVDPAIRDPAQSKFLSRVETPKLNTPFKNEVEEAGLQRIRFQDE